MADVVLTLPIQVGEESRLFGHFLNRFVESRSFEAEEMADSYDAPFLMVRSDPGDGEEIKILTFQARSVASEFSSGWSQARTKTAARQRA